MKFSWSRSVYFAARLGVMGFAAGLLIGLIMVLAGVPGQKIIGVPLALFNLALFCSLAWDLFTKEPPDA